MNVLITGASGFVGSAVTKALDKKQYSVRPIFRSQQSLDKSGLSEHLTKQTKLVKSFTEETDWAEALSDIDVVIHSAARVHVMNDTSSDPLAEFRKINVDATLHLAKEAAKQGVSRFIFISSIKVNGEQTSPGRPYLSKSIPSPVDPYGISKFEAENKLLELGQETGMQIVIVRPVLVYGPGVKANFKSMMSWLLKKFPLPLGSIKNKRSLVYIENLTSLLETCTHHPAAANNVFLVSDGEDLSTTALLKRMAKALNKPSLLVPIPEFILSSGLSIIGKRDIAQRLCSSLQVDINHTCNTLNWKPPVSVDDALKITADDFIARNT